MTSNITRTHVYINRHTLDIKQYQIQPAQFLTSTASCVSRHISNHSSPTLSADIRLVWAQISLMDEGGNLKDDLKLPSGTDEAEKLAKDLAAEFEDGKELVVTVIKVRLLHINLKFLASWRNCARVWSCSIFSLPTVIDPTAQASASSRVDLPEPFSPTRNVTGD